MSNTISMQTIAEAAGVTRTTVSLALRHHPRISTQTGERVRLLARSLGYHPNANLSRIMRSIREGRQDETFPVLAFAHDGHCDPAFFDDLRIACREAGYRPDLLNCQEISGARLGQILYARNISIVLIAHRHATELLEKLNTERLCICVLSDTSVGHHRIDPHQAASDWVVREAVDLLDYLLRHHRYGTPAHPKVIRADSPDASARNLYPTH